MKKQLFAFISALAGVNTMLSATAAPSAPKKDGSAKSKVSITKVIIKRNPEYKYFRVLLDFSAAPNSKHEHFLVGEEYGKQIKNIEPEFEKYVDSYFAYLDKTVKGSYLELLKRANAIRAQVPELYQSEIDGIAKSLSGGTTNKAGDGKVSRDELYALNLLADIARLYQCSAFGADGVRTTTGATILGRNLDWGDGDAGHPLSQIQASITVKNGSQRKSALLLGFLGYQAWCTGLSKDGLFGAILDAPTGALYPVVPYKRRSYSMDLRDLMETSQSKDAVANGIMSTAEQQKYCYNHLILFADKTQVSVIENNYLGYKKGKLTHFKPAVRYSDSPFHDDNDRPIPISTKPNPIEWPSAHTIGTVNSFLMLGHQDNQRYPVEPTDYIPKPVAQFRDEGGNRKNTERLKLMSERVRAIESTKQPYTSESVKSVITAHRHNPPGDMKSGDLYNSTTIQSFVVEFNKNGIDAKVSAFFNPALKDMPDNPLFQSIPMDW